MVVCTSRFVQEQCVFEGANSQEIVYNFITFLAKSFRFYATKVSS